MHEGNGSTPTFKEVLAERQRFEEGPLQGRRVEISVEGPQELYGVIVEEKPLEVTVLLRQPHQGSRLMTLQRDPHTGGATMSTIGVPGRSWRFLPDPPRGTLHRRA